MIKDNIQNAEKYFNLSEKIKIGLKFLAETDFSELENGRVEILGSEIYANVQDYTSKPESEGKFEAHREYTDIQFVVDGEEKIGVGDIKYFSGATDYDNNKDIIFLNPNQNCEFEFINLKNREFAIFYPQDAHMPSIALNKPSFVRKVVVKVKN